MKYKILGLVLMGAMLLCAAAAVHLDDANSVQRVHQHLSARQPDAGCDCDGSTLCTHLPLVVIDTGGQTVPGATTGERDRFDQSIYATAADGSTTINVDVSVIDNETRNNHPDDAPALTTRSTMRIRGNSSRSFEKKQYLLNFVDDQGENKDLEVMGMAAHHEWVLNGPYLDKTLIRNYMWYNISGEIMEYAPNVRFCEVIVDGEYRGLYLMVESVTDGEEGRLNLSENAQNKKVNGYLLRIDRPTEEGLTDIRNIDTFLERSGQLNLDISVRYPGRSRLTEEEADLIEKDFSDFERALYSYDYDDRRYGYRTQIDVDNFIDYYLINEFSANVDAGNYSTYLYKSIGTPYKLCVWDFNNVCDNYQDEETSPYEFFLYDRPLFNMLLKDEDFVERLIDRYHELRQGVFSDAYLTQYIDATIAYLGDAVARNNAVWSEVLEDDTLMVPKTRNIRSYDEAVTQLKTFLDNRGDWIDRNIDSLRQYCHPSHTKTYNY